MSAPAVWAGIIVTDLEASAAWYVDTTGARLVEESGRWVALRYGDGSCLELYAGDPSMPGLTFPSYGSDPGPPVMPGFSVDEGDALAGGFEVARSLPGWIVVIAPSGLRVVLADRDSDAAVGLIGFDFMSPDADDLRAFLGRVGAVSDVTHGERLAVVPVVAAAADDDVTDPDGNVVRLRSR